MAFGALLGTLTGNNVSIPNPLDATGSVAVSIGDLIVGLLVEQIALTSSGCTDNLGNSYTAQNAGTDNGSSTGRLWYSRVTVAGTLTTVHFAATAGTDNAVAIVACFAGPFASPPIDKSPANGASDIVSPFTCPATGTLSQAVELVIGWVATAASGTTGWVGSGVTVAIMQADTGAKCSGVIGYVVTSTTASVTPAFTGTAPNSDTVPGTVSFMQAATVPPIWRPVRNLYFKG